jgi:hypothetical protein
MNVSKHGGKDNEKNRTKPRQRFSLAANRRNGRGGF